jgi:hypothetical protein
MLVALHARAPELIAATSRAEWVRARTHLTAGLGLLRYHKVSAQPMPQQELRWARMSATRDALMAQNLLDIRAIETGRGPTLVFAHNLHLQRNASHMGMGPMQIDWHSAGAIVSSLVGDRYTFVVGSLGDSKVIELQEPEPNTYEGFLQRRTNSWSLTRTTEIPPADKRTDTTPQQGYFPLDKELLAGADAVLHINAGTRGKVTPWPPA